MMANVEDVSGNKMSSAGDKVLQKSVMEDGRFKNPWPFFRVPGLFDIGKMILKHTDNSKVPPQQELDSILPVLTPNYQKLLNPPENGIQVTWIGHATLLIQMEKRNILTDPIFSERCSMVQFMGPKRFRHVPCSIEELPQIDAVVISHNHYDHLDSETVYGLNERFGSKLSWYIPKGLGKWMQESGCANVIEMDWWDEQRVPGATDLKFVFTPAQHWCKRSLHDENKVLWGSWCMISPWNKFFFTGDTGYCSVFKQIGETFGPFDVAAIPIGAYEPREIMQPQHVNPAEAVQLHEDIQSKKSIAIHWGTFKLSYEFYLDPPRKLKEALLAKGMSAKDFTTLQHGETYTIGDTYNNVD